MLIIKNNQALSTTHDPKLGDFYGRFDNDKVLYMATSHTSGDNGHNRYGLINITSGKSYTSDRIFIHEIFGNHSDKFYLITKDIKIIVD